jgi:ElaB/YqjD/DUF883 family membrane-anchored ribosome-binding protein
MSTTSSPLGAHAQEVSNEIKEVGGIVRDAAQETFGQVHKSAAEIYEQGRDKIYCPGSAFGQYARERPVKSVLIAAGIGLLFGSIWMRR